MNRRDDNYYEAHAKTISIILDKITSSDNNADIIQRLHANDPTFTFLQISGNNEYIIDEHDFVIDSWRDDLGWLGYFVGTSKTLETLYIESLPADVHRSGAFIEGLSRNQSIQTLIILTDIGSTYFRQMGDFFRNNNSLRELSFGNMDTIGIDSARSIAFMLSQGRHSNLRKICFEESNASEAVLAEIVTAISSHPHLEELNLGENNLGRDGSVALGNSLQACRNPQLKELFLWSNSIDDEGLRAMVAGMRNCHNLSQLDLSYNELITVDGFRSLSNLFQSGRCHLKHLDLSCMNIGDDGARAISTGLASLNSLETLYLSENDIGDDGASSLVTGLANLHSLTQLYLSDNSIGDAGASALAAGLINLHSLEDLRLSDNPTTGDLGLQALVEGLVNCVNLKYLHLSGNIMITASGLSSLSTILQSERCSLTDISLRDIPFGDEGAAALADALKGNKSMKHLRFDPESARVTSVGWSAFSKLLCDTSSSVNNTYLSNHSLETIGKWKNDDTPDDVKQLLELKKHLVAIHKILKSHSDFDIESFFEWKLKLLPLVLSWFERVVTLVDDHGWISDESTEEIQSRQLSTMYNFVRGMPLLTIDGYRSRNNAAVLANSRKRKIEHLKDES